MPVLLNADASFSSKQELLDLQDCPLSGDPSLDTPSPVDSQTGSPVDPRPRSPDSPGPDVPIHLHIFTGASSVPGQTHGAETKPHAEKPLGLQVTSPDSDQLCGWGALTPKAMQVFNTPRWVLLFLSLAAFLQGMIINGFINTVITSIERRFDLHSYETGLIVSSYDIAACICVTFVSYFGGTGHKPRWLGWGVLIMALGSLVFALPHFTSPAYQVTMSEQTGMCSANRTSPCQDKEGGGMSNYRFVFMLGQFLHGIGATPLYTLGVAYLDENVNSNSAPIYVGIFYAAAVLGPAAGYLLGGSFLNIYSEVHLTTEMNPEDPNWIGAWWIGFLVGGAAALLVSFPILGYPRQLPGSQKHASSRVSQAHQLKDGSHTTASDPEFGKSIKDMPRSVLLLLKNPTFVFLCLTVATEATLVAGVSTFGPKFLESQFNLSASEASTLFGFIVVPAGGGGTLLGGYIVKRFKLRCRGMIRFCMVCTMASLVAILIFLTHCPNVPMAGVTAPYQSGLMEKQQLEQYKRLYDKPSKMQPGNRFSLDLNLTVDCNVNCSCVRELYSPVCGADDMMYYSPCHAGCTSINHTDVSTGKQVYSGCSCVVGNVSWGEEGFALAGKCNNSCDLLPVFLAVLFIAITFTFLCQTPTVTAILRCVPDSQRSFALGIQLIVMRALGTIPGPIAFGAMIDLSCLLWQDQCGEQGSCYLYQNSTMSQYILISAIIYKALGAIFYLFANIMYQPPPESPQSSCESTDQGNLSDLPIKDLPEDGVIVNLHARL